MISCQKIGSKTASKHHSQIEQENCRKRVTKLGDQYNMAVKSQPVTKRFYKLLITKLVLSLTAGMLNDVADESTAMLNADEGVIP